MVALRFKVLFAGTVSPTTTTALTEDGFRTSFAPTTRLCFLLLSSAAAPCGGSNSVEHVPSRLQRFEWYGAGGVSGYCHPDDGFRFPELTTGANSHVLRLRLRLRSRLRMPATLLLQYQRVANEQATLQLWLGPCTGWAKQRDDRLSLPNYRSTGHVSVHVPPANASNARGCSIGQVANIEQATLQLVSLPVYSEYRHS
jgi:hypothetical protein